LCEDLLPLAEYRELFAGIASQHDGAIATVRQYSLERDLVFDLGVML
jgi:hypothetical protein